MPTLKTSPPTTDLTREEHLERTVKRLFVVGTLAILVLIFGVWLSQYQGRITMWQAQQRGCNRSVERDLNAAVAWSVAAATRKLQGDVGTATAYSNTATVLWRFATVDCGSQYPKPGLL